MASSRKKAVLAFAALAVAAGVTVGGVLLTDSSSSPSAQAEATKPLKPLSRAECATKVHYFANDDGKNGKYDFGRAVTLREVNEVKTNLNNKRCQDPAELTAHEGEVGFVGLGEATQLARVQQLLADREAWRNAVERLEKLEATARTEIGTVTGDYWSLFMVKGEPPRLGQDPLVDGHRSTVIRFTYPKPLPSGRSVIEFRLDCGYQPMRQEEFPAVKRVAETSKQPPGTTTPPETPSGKTSPPPPPTCENPPCEPPTRGGKDVENANSANKSGHTGSALPQRDPVGPPAGGKPPATTPRPAPPPPPATTPRPAPPSNQPPPVVVDPEPSHTTAPPPPPDW